MKRQVIATPNIGILTCVVLDLDETLVHSSSKGVTEMKKVKDTMKEAGQMDRYYEFKLGKETYWGLKRPYYKSFLRWCRSQFDIVAVWTAGDTDYADEIVSKVFERRPPIVWSRPNCVRANGIYYKPMDKFFRAFPDIDRDNTVIIDDRADIAEYNEDILIEIPRFKPAKPLLFDNTLISTLAYLRNALASGEKLRFLDKSVIF
jgi:TFIIF-interacting CTD phosphatase-like protein